ncbi:MAG TPA: hypothetical protein VFK32_01500, partial [Tepidiformaceae bacterium]|nr:hypothetical protein [Tepidiformaceae bacterium]
MRTRVLTAFVCLVSFVSAASAFAQVSPSPQTAWEGTLSARSLQVGSTGSSTHRFDDFMVKATSGGAKLTLVNGTWHWSLAAATQGSSSYITRTFGICPSTELRYSTGQPGSKDLTVFMDPYYRDGSGTLINERAYFIRMSQEPVDGERTYTSCSTSWTSSGPHAINGGDWWRIPPQPYHPRMIRLQGRHTVLVPYPAGGVPGY